MSDLSPQSGPNRTLSQHRRMTFTQAGSRIIRLAVRSEYKRGIAQSLAFRCKLFWCAGRLL